MTIQKRTNLEIRSDILKTAQNGVIKTQIVYRAYLNFSIVKKYLADLIEDGRLVQNGKRYFTTPRGLEYIKHMEALLN